MPPKGRKKIAAEAKSNGASTTVQVDETPAANLKSRGRPRKGAAIEEAMEVDPNLNGEAAVKENGSTKVVPEKSMDNEEENINGKIEIPEKKLPTKRGRKAGNQEATEVESKNTEEGDASAQSASEVEIEPEVKSPAKRGRKKAADQLPKEEVKESEEIVEEQQEKMPAKRRRKKATNQMSEPNNGEKSEVESTDTEAKAEPEKVAAKRGRKKAEEPVPTKEEEEETVEAEPKKVAAKRGRKKAEEPVPTKEDGEDEIVEIAAKAGPSKRQRIVEVDLDEPEDDDFAPRKTRGARHVQEVAAPVERGRKRKGNGNPADGKESKKGKSMEEVAETQLKKLTVDIKRDAKLDERAKNASAEEEPLVEEDSGEKVKEVAGKTTSGRKRANKDEDDAKPAKAKKEAPVKKSGSKKEQIPDVTALDFGNDSKSPEGKPWNFKIASWNVSGVRAWLEKNGLSYLHHEKPDILCLQETKCSKDKLPAELEKIEGYHCHWLEGEKEGYSGVAILSKEKPISIKDGIGIGEHDNEGRVIKAEYEKFYLVTSYVPNSGRGLPRLDYRQKFDKDFREYLKELDKIKPVILCGDLNVAHHEIDLANPKSNKRSAGFTQEERDGLSALLDEGFVDTFRHLYPDTKAAYTFWTYMMNARAKNVGWRLDYFLISEGFQDHLCDNVIRKDVMGSDHCPIALFLHI